MKRCRVKTCPSPPLSIVRQNNSLPLKYSEWYPETPAICQGCGETRVVEVAHKLNYKRKNVYRSKENSSPDKVWILCPTCHRLIDRGYAKMSDDRLVMLKNPSEIYSDLLPKLPPVNCSVCLAEFVPTRRKQKFCSISCKKTGHKKHRAEIYKNNLQAISEKQAAAYRVRISGSINRKRNCLECQSTFIYDPNRECAKKYCSDQCFKTVMKRKRKEAASAYKKKHGHAYASSCRDSHLGRFIRRNPSVQLLCESCGDNRILELAHKPSFHRGGMICRSPSRDQIWLLCPTCHVLIDRMGYNPVSLGLS